MDRISIIIPTFNEEENIKKAYDFVKKNEFINYSSVNISILFSDDNSTDKTRKYINELTKFDNKVDIYTPISKKGLGFALITATQSCFESDYIVFLDCDITITQKNFSELLSARKKNTMIIGSRYLKNSILRKNNFRLLLSKLINSIFFYLFNMPAKDSSHSLRIFDNRIKIKTLNNTHPGFFFEITKNYKKDNCSIDEIPVNYLNREMGKSKISLITITKSILVTLKNMLCN